MHIHVTAENITEISADALIAPIDSKGVCPQRMSTLISGDDRKMFYQQVVSTKKLAPDQTVVAHRQNAATEFEHIVFVTDTQNESLSDMMYTGLKVASDNEFRTVTLPVIQMGTTFAFDDIIEEIVRGIEHFLALNLETSLSDITIGTLGDTVAEEKLKTMFTA